jgi:hypothetical protein
MGISCAGRNSDARYDEQKGFKGGYIPPPSSNPENYEILRSLQMGKYLIVEIKYPDCKNYEGKKIMVYEGDIKQLVSQKKIDPHFSDNCAFKSPIGRFEPTNRGWNMAKTFCAGMAGQTINWTAEDFK